MPIEELTTGGKALSAFNTFSGAFGLATGLVGLFTPDPLQEEVDELGEDLAEIKDQIEEVSVQLDGISNLISERFDIQSRAEINVDYAAVQTAHDRVGALRRNLSDDVTDTINFTQEKVADLIGRLQPSGLTNELATEVVTNMISALNHAVALRLTLAHEYEDGAVGRQGIKDILTNAASAIDGIAARHEAYIMNSDDYIERQFRPIATYTLSRWSGEELADILIGYNASQGGGFNDGILALRAFGDETLTQGEYYAVLQDAYTFDQFRTLSASSYLNENRPDLQSTWRPQVTNLETEEVTTSQRVIRYEREDYNDIVASLGRGLDVIEQRVRNDYLAELNLDELRDVADNFRDLAKGIDRVVPDGADILAGTADFDLLTGLDGDDVINAGARDDVVRAGDGNDILRGEAGADVLMGQSGDDRAEGGEGDDVLYGGSGRDSLNGGAGEDQLLGGDGADYLNGDAGDDLMSGGLGNDFYIIGSLGDEITGEIGFSQGGGIDTVRTYIDDYVQPDNIELVRITDLTGTQNFNATGNDAPGTLVGNAGDNVLTGRGGNDQINGNGGDDRLIGGVGRDTLVGGAGADTFVYTSISESRAGAAERDVINGFDRGQDQIDLSAMDANLGGPGDAAFDFIGFGRFSGEAGELRLQSLGGANAVLVEGDLRGDGEADFQIFVNLRTQLSADDFIL